MKTTLSAQDRQRITEARETLQASAALHEKFMHWTAHAAALRVSLGLAYVLKPGAPEDAE